MQKMEKSRQLTKAYENQPLEDTLFQSL